MDLKNVPTQELVKELESRNDIEKVSVGQYASYELRRKYNQNRNQINAKTVLVIK
jgi:hypothetical protein